MELSHAEKVRIHAGGHQCHRFPCDSYPKGASYPFLVSLHLLSKFSHKTSLSFLMQGIGHLKQGFKEGSDVILHVFGDNHSAGFKEATAVGAAGAAGGEGEMHRFGV